MILLKKKKRITKFSEISQTIWKISNLPEKIFPKIFGISQKLVLKKLIIQFY